MTKRYDLILSESCGPRCYSEMQPAEYGDWVDADDYDAINPAAAAFAALVEARADLSFNKLINKWVGHFPTGKWSGQTLDNGTPVPGMAIDYDADPCALIERMHAQWVEAGRPCWPSKKKGGAA